MVSGVATGRSERVPEDATVDLESLWAHAIDGLADSTVTPQQRAWLRTTRPLGLLDGTALLAAPNEFTKDVLETRLRPMITTALSGLLGREIRVAVTVEPPDGPEAGQDPDQLAEDTQPGLTWPPPSPSNGRSHARVEPARLNPKYTFETFVIGSCNRFAHAAAVAVAEAPAKAYNPLFIYGDSGLGKTHLLHAIGHYAQRLFQNARVRYVSSEEFTNDFINSLRDDKQSAFQRRYRDVDILLIDDIQFLESKERTQEEFFHTFNTLHNANKQIVISSRPAAEAALDAGGPAAHPVRVGADHRRPAAGPGDADRDPAEEGGPGAAERAAGRAGVHRVEDPVEHPRARGCADPGHRVRQPQPAERRPDPGRDRAQGPHRRTTTGPRSPPRRSSPRPPSTSASRSTTSAASRAAGCW